MAMRGSSSGWVRGGAALAVVTLALGGCGGEQDSGDAARDFVRAMNDGSIATHPDLFEPAPSARQMSKLEKVSQRCDFDERSIEVLPGGLTPQVERFVVVATCDDSQALVGASTYRELDSGGGRPNAELTIGPEFLPGGSHAGKFPRDLLLERTRGLPAL